MNMPGYTINDMDYFVWQAGEVPENYEEPKPLEGCIENCKKCSYAKENPEAKGFWMCDNPNRTDNK